MTLKESDLEPVNDKKIIERYLQYTLDLQEIISLYLPEDDYRITAHSKKLDAANLILEVEIEDSHLEAFNPVRKNIQDKKAKVARVNFSTHDVIFFVSADILELKGSRLSFRATVPIYKLQRRGALRIKLQDSHKCELVLGTKKFKPHDLSASGISILLPPKTDVPFKKKDILKDSKIDFNGQSATLDLEVSSISELKGSGQTKIGFRFLRLPTSIEQEIAREAYAYTQKIWARWI